jgi:hypothetical protein
LFGISSLSATDSPPSQLGNDYVLYMEQKLRYYENMSLKLFGRNIPQILLMHANLLNADHLDRLAEMFKRNGYSFTSLETALKDDTYRTPVSVSGKWGREHSLKATRKRQRMLRK